MAKFHLKADYKPLGDQPEAIKKLTTGINQGEKNQTLLGVTGSGKTFTMANIIANTQKPTLVLSHNKTLAAQLYNEFRLFFPDNAVHYFVSYFDYYQPEAYVARSDTYIEKDSAINEEIDRLRHAATAALLSRKDVIIVASVSCIYGIGSVEDYGNLAVRIKAGERRVRDKLLRQLTDIQYQRNDIDFHRSTFRVRGDVVDIFPAGEEAAYRVEFFGDELERIARINPLTGEIETNLKEYTVFPGSHYVTPHEKLKYALQKIREEAEERKAWFDSHGKLLLPSALDNRPLTFTEFERHMNQVIFVSATPAEFELSRSPDPAQQIIRPTGLLDPQIEVRPIEGQIDDLIAEIRINIDKQHRVLVTTLTKRMAEDLSEYLKELNIKVAYIHSDIDTLERTDILRDLRLGVYDVLVGINLLREGLDLPEVSLVAILDADKEGFLRSEQALIQTVGRAARHQDGRVIMYADKITKSMQRTIDETDRRRLIQEEYNLKHGITPTSISREVGEMLPRTQPQEAKPKLDFKKIPKDEYKHVMKDLTAQMDLAAANLEFEKAADLRDLIEEIKSKL
jgi:excinuclease UvrABC helicase subunit UvrB